MIITTFPKVHRKPERKRMFIIVAFLCSEGNLLPCIGNLVYIILLVITFSYNKYHSIFFITMNRWKQNRILWETNTDIKV